MVDAAEVHSKEFSVEKTTVYSICKIFIVNSNIGMRIGVHDYQSKADLVRISSIR